MSIVLDAKIPDGPLADKWDEFKAHEKLVNPTNKRKFKIIVVGTGLAGASAAATLAELGYQVDAFTFHDSPRRAHSIAAQGGINAAKNYQGDGDWVYRLFYDTIKGGDFRAREANVYRLAQVSVNIIDQMVAQGVPFAREYGGLLDNRSFGGAQVSRTFYARGQTGQQLLLGAYQQLARQVGLGGVRLFNRMELVDVVVVDGRCAGIVCRDLLTGEISSHAAHAVVLATGGYGNAFFLSTNAMQCNVTAAWRAHRKGAAFANPCYTQIHPTCIPQADDFQSKLTLMSESLRNDGRVWVPPNPDDTRSPDQIPEDERDYYLERMYPSFGNLAPRDIASRAAKRAVDSGRGVGPLKNGVYLDFADAIGRLGSDVVKERYGNLFDMYERITGEDPYTVPMRIYPASHYTMGGLWVDYELMTTIPGLYCAGEANFSDHGANRLGASALMQGLADGYFVLPYTISNYLAALLNKPIPGTDHEAFKAAEAAAGRPVPAVPVDRWHPLARLLPPRARQDHLGLLRHGAHRARASRRRCRRSPRCTTSSRRTCASPATATASTRRSRRPAASTTSSSSGMLMCRDALERRESCGGHFRAEYQDEEGEAQRDDDNFAHVAAWEWTGDPMAPDSATRKQLEYEVVHFQTSGATSEQAPDQHHAQDLAPGRARRRRPVRDLHGRRDQRRGLVPRDARPAQRAPDRRRQGSDRVRPRLPRGHLRHVLADDRRSGARSAARHGDVPAAHAQVPERRHDHDRAVAGERLPDHQGPDGRPVGVRPHRRGRWLHHRRDRRRARRQPDPDPQAGRRRGRWTPPSASAAVRAWRPARTVPPTCSPAPRSPTSTCCRRARPSASAASRRWSRRWTSHFGSCTNHGECEAACPKSISIDVIALMNADYLKSKFKNRKKLCRT